MAKFYKCGEDQNKPENKEQYGYWAYVPLGLLTVGAGIRTIAQGNETREYYTENRAEYTEPGNGVEMLGSDWLGLATIACGAILLKRNYAAFKKALVKVKNIPDKVRSFYNSCVKEAEQDRAWQEAVNRNKKSRGDY